MSEGAITVTKKQKLFDISNFPKAGDFVNAVLSGKYRVVIYGGAIRGGKTFSSIGATVLLHKAYPYSRSIIVRDNLQTLKTNTLPSCQKVIPSNFVKKHNAGNFYWHFTNNSTMFFFGENIHTDPELDRWNGLEVNFIILEQCEELQFKTFEKSLERVGSYVIPLGGKQPPPMILVTVNPTDTWAYETFFKPWVNGTLPDNWLYIPAFITDNPFIPKSYLDSLEELRKVNPVKYERFVKGDWEVREKIGGEFYQSYNFGKHIMKVPYLPDYPVWLSFDFNVLPYMTMLCAQLVRKPGSPNVLQLRIFKGYFLPHPINTTKDCCEAFERDYGTTVIRQGVIYTGDASGNNPIPGLGDIHAFDAVEEVLYKYLTQYSDQVLRRNPAIFKRRDFVNDIFAGAYDLEILIDEGVKELQTDLSKVRVGAKGKLKERVKDPKTNQTWEAYGHPTDALDYLVVAALGDYSPTPLY